MQTAKARRSPLFSKWQRGASGGSVRPSAHWVTEQVRREVDSRLILYPPSYTTRPGARAGRVVCTR